MIEQHCDVAIVGAGIVGLAVGLQLIRRNPGLRVIVLDKEADVASHQTGHNSGVLHSGLYYKPGSLKARLCVEGRAALVQFCQEHGIPYEICGKIIVATTEEEIPRLRGLLDRGQANGILGLKLLDKARRETGLGRQPRQGSRLRHAPCRAVPDRSLASSTHVVQ